VLRFISVSPVYCAAMVFSATLLGAVLQSIMEPLQNVGHSLVPPANMFLNSCFVTGDIWAVWTLTVRFFATF
jgi:hypothetical protein